MPKWGISCMGMKEARVRGERGSRGQLETDQSRPVYREDEPYKPDLRYGYDRLLEETLPGRNGKSPEGGLTRAATPSTRG